MNLERWKEFKLPNCPRLDSGHERLYRLEDKLTESFQNAAHELGSILGHKNTDKYFPRTLFWELTMPEALATFLDCYETYSVGRAIQRWLLSHPDIAHTIFREINSNLPKEN